MICSALLLTLNGFAVRGVPLLRENGVKLSDTAFDPSPDEYPLEASEVLILVMVREKSG